MSHKTLTAKSLSNKQYRDAFVTQQVTQGLAFQIRALRKSRKLTQKDLGDKIGSTSQAAISRWERPVERPSLSTLLKLASAFDVGLVVRFAPFSELVDYATSITVGSLEVPEHAADDKLQDYERESEHESALHPWTNIERVSPGKPWLSVGQSKVQHVLSKWKIHLANVEEQFDAPSLLTFTQTTLDPKAAKVSLNKPEALNAES